MQESSRVTNNRGAQRPHTLVSRTRHINNLVLRQWNSREMLENDNIRTTRVSRNDIPSQRITPLVRPRRLTNVLFALDTEESDHTAISTLDDDMLEERQEVNSHLSCALFNQE